MWRRLLIRHHELQKIEHEVSEIWLEKDNFNQISSSFKDDMWYIVASFKCCKNKVILHNSKKTYDRIQGDKIKFPVQIYDSGKEILICKNL